MHLTTLGSILRKGDLGVRQALKELWRRPWIYWRHVSAFALTCLAIFVCCDTFALVVRYFSPLIYWDAWATVEDYRRYVAGQYGFADLFAQHNEHRIVFPRLVFLADFVLGRGLNVINVGTTNLIQCLHAALLVRIAASVLPGFRFVAVAAIICILMLNFGHAGNLQWGFQVPFVGVYAAASLAFWWFARSFPPQGVANRGLAAASFVMVLVATYCMSNGFIAGFVLVLLAIVRRARPAFVVLAFVFALAVTAAYFHDFQYVSRHSPPGYVLEHPFLVLAYVLVYLGGPLGKFGVINAGALGAFGIALTAAAAIRSAIAGREPEARTAMLGIMLFIGLTAAATALGRVFFGLPQAVESRYLAPVAAFWAAQAIYWTSLQVAAGRRLATATLALSAAILLIGSLRSHLTVRDRALWASRRLDAVTLVLLSGVDRPDILRIANPVTDDVVRLSRFLSDQRLNIFARPVANWRGLPISGLGIKRDDSACSGASLAVTKAPRGEVLVGWAWDNLREVPVRQVVITNSQDRVVGFGFGDWFWFRPDRKKTPRVRSFDVGWRAYAKDPGEDFRAYAVLDNDRVVCRLPRMAPPARPDGSGELPKQIDLSRIGASIDVERTMEGGWKEDGLPRPDEARAAIGTVSGSWSHGEGTTGSLRMGPFVAPGAKLGVPYLTGADASGLAIELIDAETDQIYARVRPGSTPKWSAMEIDIPSGMAGRNLILRGLSNKGGTDAWLALGMPRAIR